MSIRIQTHCLLSAMILCGTALAQNTSGPPGQSSNPPMNTPGAGGATTPSTFPGDRPSASMDTDLHVNDKAFVKKAAEDSVTEVELGKLAQEKGSSDAVKEYGKRMVEDHTAAGRGIAGAAAKVDVEVPSELPRGSKKTREKLAKLSGPDFDRAYAKLMLNNQRDKVESFTQEARLGRDPDVREFAAKTLPTIQQHRKMAEELQASVKK